MEVMDILEEARHGTPCMLMRGSDKVVAYLNFQETDDFPWIVFGFQALLAWDDLGPNMNIFGGSQGLKVRELIEARISLIQQLDLWLATADRKIVVGDFIFSIRGDLAFFRSHARGQSIQSSVST